MTDETADWSTMAIGGKPGTKKPKKRKVSKNTKAQKRTGREKKGDKLPIDQAARSEYATRKKEAGAHGATLGHDKDGYFIYTHRARSKSYASPAKIPLAKIRFVGSTG